MDEILSLDEEDTGSMTLTEIYNQVYALGEVILTIPAEEEERLRKGLASVKAKANKKMQEEGMPVDKSMLSYNTTPAKQEDGTPRIGAVDVHISLSSRNAIRVLDMKLPDNSI